MFWNKSRWSEVPGCFERHLQRRDGNVLFSLERRTVSKGEIAGAQKRDKIDQDKFVETVKILGIALDNSEKTTSLSTLRDSSSLQKIQALLEEAASIGGNIQNEIRLMESLEESITKSLNVLAPEGKELLKKAQSLSITARIPFIAQLKRKDTPILKSEVVPTLLSEDFGTISVIGLMSRSFPDFKPCETDITKTFDAAIFQGFSKERAQEILNAWSQII